jgi:hypothetical protein
MKLIPEQMAEWQEKGSRAWLENSEIMTKGRHDNYVAGYIHARTEQAAEIVELKAKLSEVMPLAKYAAWHLTLTVIQPDDVNELCQDAYNKAVDAVLFEQDKKLNYQPNIEATIEQLRKD